MMRLRLRTLEAMVWVGIARLLIRHFPFRAWRRWLGKPAQLKEASAEIRTLTSQERESLRCCVAAVGRASYRLPGTICLPRAMALQWMLRRREIGSMLVIGVLPQSLRDRVDDLHAWVECEGAPVIGDSGGKHAGLLFFLT